MNFLQFDREKCDLCEVCIEKCPFNALEIIDAKVVVNDACRMCGICIKACPQEAIYFEQKSGQVDKTKWKGFLIFAEQEEGTVHPVTFELVGEAKRLSEQNGFEVNVAVMGGEETAPNTEMLRHFGVDRIFVYEHERLKHFRADAYANAMADCVTRMQPSVVLVGATSLGRSLAPRLATRFHTGLTADCTKLEMRENTDLVQIRPAFGGNVMAQILTTNSRPQFATVRYKVMDAPQKKQEASGEIIRCQVPQEMVDSKIEVKDVHPAKKSRRLEDEDVLVVAGRGVKDEKGLKLVEELADALEGQVCYTRAIVDEGMGDPARQIGLSGKTVKPKLIVTCGVSGSIQFAAGMNGADCIVAIDSDPKAQIFGLAHYCMTEDLYQVLPPMIDRLKEKKEADLHAFSVS
ncbi:MAG TPA: electron transfer flavoprotein subunit alpha [Eubacteriaceae bacterium]|nr:electron transfer flavoprotein subunit alpha [Eubacteriaceae bacterium]